MKEEIFLNNLSKAEKLHFLRRQQHWNIVIVKDKIIKKKEQYAREDQFGFRSRKGRSYFCFKDEFENETWL